jgi:glycosyltransferase involved in cell wall biosynthesis
MTPLSVFVITYNNTRTLPACLESVRWADEIVVVDSLSTDDTVEIARRYGARVIAQEFLGFGKQKRFAMDRTTHDWVLLIDADEQLSPALQREIQDLLKAGPTADGYKIPRLELLFWRMASPRARKRAFLRLFDKRKGRFTDMPIHSEPKVDGRIATLKSLFYHYGQTDLATKIGKVNLYSSSLVPDKIAKGRRGNPFMMVFYPPYYFFVRYFLNGHFLNGWAGFMIACADAIYVFLKYAKLYEHFQFERHDQRLLPENAPRLDPPRLERPA